MSQTISFDTEVLKLIFQGDPIPLMADNAIATPLANLYVSLHYADPGDTEQQTNEQAYTGYARAAVPRTALGWNVLNGTVAPINIIFFPAPTEAPSQQDRVAYYFGIGSAATGASTLFYKGRFQYAIGIANGIPPYIDNLPGYPGEMPAGWEN